MTAPALAHALAPVVYAAPSVLALTVKRGVWKARGEHGETVLFASTSSGRVLLDGPVVLPACVSPAETARLLWRMLNALDPRVRIGHSLN